MNENMISKRTNMSSIDEILQDLNTLCISLETQILEDNFEIEDVGDITTSIIVNEIQLHVWMSNSATHTRISYLQYAGVTISDVYSFKKPHAVRQAIFLKSSLLENTEEHD